MSDHTDTFRTERPDRSGEVMAGMEIVESELPAAAQAKPEAKISAIQQMWDDVDADRPGAAEPGRRRLRLEATPRSKWLALPGTVMLGLLAVFFCWVSAEPFWLSMGHGVQGTVSVSECGSGGPGSGCHGQFTPDHGGDPWFGMRLSGDPDAGQAGAELDARAVSERASVVYVGDDWGLHLRWGMGLAMALACGVGVAAVSGAWRWRGRARVATVGVSLAGPAVLWLIAVAVAYW